MASVPSQGQLDGTFPFSLNGKDPQIPELLVVALSQDVELLCCFPGGMSNVPSPLFQGSAFCPFNLLDSVFNNLGTQSSTGCNFPFKSSSSLFPLKATKVVESSPDFLCRHLPVQSPIHL